ncbi:MAG: hypothetical protein GXY20_00550 [Clostridiales bacterium]|nr:hypothetical protein [Clostridiales bacterium]
MEEFEKKLNSLLSDPGSMERVMQLAKSLAGSEKASEDTSSLSGADAVLDPELLKLFTGAMREFNSSGDAAAIVAALKPFLSNDRAERIDRALGIARLAKIARKLLPGIIEGQPHK